MSLLIKKEIFEEPLSRFYIAELTCAVESVHKMGFIHRYVVIEECPLFLKWNFSNKYIFFRLGTSNQTIFSSIVTGTSSSPTLGCVLASGGRTIQNIIRSTVGYFPVWSYY